MRVALAAALAAATLTWLLLLPRTRGARWRVDEAHKVSETYALRLVLEGRWDDPAWSANIVDRTNPPFGKYAFGLGALAAGEEIPRVPSLSRLAVKGVMEPFVPDAHARPYLPLLAPARRVSLLATALTIALVAFVAARVHSLAAAAIASAWSAWHWMTAQFGADAIFDPLLAMLVLATLPLALSKRFAPLAGVVCAMAFQTRLNGGIALAASLAVLLLHKRWKTALIVAVTFAAAAFAMNPFYWDGPHRFPQQVSELRTILDALTTDGVRLPLWAAADSARAPIPWTAFQKLRFTWIAFGGLLLARAAAGCFFAREHRALLVWCAVVILGTLIWLPLPWPRYLLVVLPPLALLAGIAYAGVLRGVLEACMWRMRQPSA